MAIVPHEDLVIPPLEAFLIAPQFVASDLWVWPLFCLVVFFMMRGYHKAAGLVGREVDLIIALKVLNGLFLWGTLIAVSRAVHRATDDLIVSGLWTGVILTVTTGGMQLVFKRSPLAPTFQRVQEAIARHRLKMKEEGKARQAAARRGADTLTGGARVVQNFTSEGPAEAKRHVSVLMRRDLFADPPPPAEPAPEAEKTPVS